MNLNWKIFVIGVIVLTLTISLTIFSINEISQAEKECKELGGNFVNRFMVVYCWDVDEEGYRFTWVKNNHGGYYKVR